MPSDKDLQAEHKADTRAFAKAIGGDKYKAMENMTLDELPPGDADKGAAAGGDKAPSTKTSHSTGCLTDLASEWLNHNVFFRF